MIVSTKIIIDADHDSILRNCIGTRNPYMSLLFNLDLGTRIILLSYKLNSIVQSSRRIILLSYKLNSIVPLVSFFASFIPNFFYRHGCIGIRFGCYHSIIADMAAVMVVEGAENAMMLRFEIF
jgi:hypothetical protein